ncbi:hypothetical protein RNO55_23800, partial [Escherichia coli]|nr:hypothetical protein [Escherichia coli]
KRFCESDTNRSPSMLLTDLLHGNTQVASAVAIGVHNLSTWNPDYEIGKNYIKRRLSVKYKKAEVL